MSTNDHEWKASFETRFDFGFRCVYAYVLRRTHDHTVAQHVTRGVLIRSLPELLDGDEHELARALLRATHRSLRSETTWGGELAPGSESPRVPTVVTRARNWLRSAQARKASESEPT